jgi:hypothetical protein
MLIGLISLSTLLALGATALGIMGIRGMRMLLDPRVSTGLLVLLVDAGLLVGSFACGLGSYHFFTKAFGG